MRPSHIVVIGASAGGVELLVRLGRALPPNFAAPVCMVLHTPARTVSVLPKLINTGTGLRAVIVKDGDRLEPGRLYFASADCHLLVQGEHVRLGHGPRENGFRPAIDPLFRSAAASFGAGAIGVVLSGALSDGTAGLLTIKASGGIAIAQDPEEALYPSMPASAVRNVAVDHVVSIEAMPELLQQLLATPRIMRTTEQSTAKPPDLEIEVAARGAAPDIPEAERLGGAPSGYACPDCHGVLWEIEDSDLIRFRCRVGHAYGPDTLVDAQAEKLEEALWSAYRALRESAALAKRLGLRARERNWVSIAASHEDRAREANERAGAIEEVLMRGKLGAVANESE